MTDPDAGTVQGIQRYGRAMATDPVQGSGYPYFVYPSVRDSGQTSPIGGNPTIRLNPLQRQRLRQQLQASQRSASEDGSNGSPSSSANRVFSELALGIQNIANDPLKTPEAKAMGDR